MYSRLIISSTVVTLFSLGALNIHASPSYALGSSSFVGSSFLGSSSSKEQTVPVTYTYESAAEPEDENIKKVISNFHDPYVSWFSSKNRRSDASIQEPISNETLRGYAQYWANSMAQRGLATEPMFLAQRPRGTFALVQKLTPAAATQDSSAVVFDAETILNHWTSSSIQNSNNVETIGKTTISQYGLGITKSGDSYYICLLVNDYSEAVFAGKNDISAALISNSLYTAINKYRTDKSVTILSNNASSAESARNNASGTLTIPIVDRSEQGAQASLAAYIYHNGSQALLNSTATHIGIHITDDGTKPVASVYIN